MVMRIINYTNVCVAQCDYCAFYVLPNQDGGYVLERERRVREDRRAARGRRRPRRVQRRLQPEAPARLLLRPLRRRPRALRRPGRVLRADRRGVRLPRRPRRAHARRGGRAAPRRGRPLGDGRRERDPHRGLPQAPREVQVHGRRVLRRAARDRRERHAHDRDDGDRLRRDARGAARAPAADARLPGRLPAGRPRRALLVPLLDVQAVRHGARRPRDRRRGSTGATSRSRGSSSTTSSTSARRC